MNLCELGKMESSQKSLAIFLVLFQPFACVLNWMEHAN